VYADWEIRRMALEQLFFEESDDAEWRVEVSSGGAAVAGRCAGWSLVPSTGLSL